MKISSALPFPALTFCHWHSSGCEMAVIIVKATFAIGAGERGGVLAQQPEILLSDIFHGTPNESSLRQESDVLPHQSKTNVTFHAFARAPEEKALESWPVRVSVADRASLAFQVCGERFWEPSGQVSKNWKLTSPKAMTSLPLRYEYAYGGQVEDGEGNVHVHEFNPVGRGFLGPLNPGTDARPAPQIGLSAEFAAASPSEPWMVCGLGPIGKAWLPRRTLAGTFDDAWKRERHPRMPADYDFAYWNGAPLPLQIAPYLKGDEVITVTGFSHDPRPYEITLPGVQPFATVHRHDGDNPAPFALFLQSVHCDIADADPEKHWVSLVWRIALSEPEEIAEIIITAQNMPPVHRPKLSVPRQADVVRPTTAVERRAQEEREWQAATAAYMDEQQYLKALEKKRRQEAEAQETRNARLTERGWSPQMIAMVRDTIKEGEPVAGWEEGAALRLQDPELNRSLVVPADLNDPRVLHIGGPDYVYRRPDQRNEWPAELPKPAPVDPWRRQPPSERPVPVLVRLLNENIDVWRPVMARQMQGNCYCLLPVNHLPKGERWEFGMMAYVHCEMRAFSTGIFLTAIRAQPRDSRGNYRF